MHDTETMATLHGKYKVKNQSKYIGDISDVVYRSSWELALMIFLDKHESVVSWSSESIAIPYVSKVDGKNHRYFPDFIIHFKNGKKFIVEIKPKHETQQPKEPKDARGKKRYIKEAMTYSKNISKWEAADEFARNSGAEFVVWTEDNLKALGINLITSSPVSKGYRAAKFAQKRLAPKRKD